MEAFDTPLQRRPRAVGLKIGVILLVVLIVAAAWVGAYYWAKHTGRLKQVDHTVSQFDYDWPVWMGKGAKKATYREPPAETNHVAFETRPQNMTQPVVATTKPSPAKTPPKPVVYRPMLFVQKEVKEPTTAVAPNTYPLTAAFIPCILETTLNSEIEGLFTVKTRGNVFDSVSGQHLLIPQGQRVVAKDASAALLFGNERIPTWALSLAMPDGSSLALGDAPIMDQSGTNGLTGTVDNHTWRLVWTSILIEGLRLGQQVLTQEIASANNGITVTGVGQYSSSLAQQRLGRAQDTRPTISVEPGQLCNILVPKTLHLPALARR